MQRSIAQAYLEGAAFTAYGHKPCGNNVANLYSHLVFSLKALPVPLHRVLLFLRPTGPRSNATDVC